MTVAARWLIEAPCVEWYLPGDRADWPRFRHVGSVVARPAPADDRAAGQSCWAAVVAGHEVGLAWDWVEVVRGVPALTDPNSLVSNLQFLSPEGEPLGDLGATVCLSLLLHQLAWQAPVRALLRRWRPGAANAADSGLSPARLTVVNSRAAASSQTRTRVQPE